MSKFNFYHIISEIQQAYSIAELEKISIKSLNLQLNIKSLTIFIGTKEAYYQKSNQLKHKFSYINESQIDHKQPIMIDYIKGKSFTRSEKKILDKVSQKIFHCCEKIIKLEKSQMLKQQWDSTFNSISIPLCLTDEKFNITRTNELFLQNLNTSYEKVIGLNAFETFFGTCNISFKIDKVAKHFSSVIKKNIHEEVRTYEVSCQLINQKNQNSLYNNKQYLIVFRDITEKKKIEKQIFDSAKFSELGTIGSSIAHELNNPIAGILAFVQLIKSDLTEGSPYKEDLVAMEEATLKCKHIVENLLGFSRKSSSHENLKVDIIKVIENVLTIYELKTNSSKINLEFKNMSRVKNVFVDGNKNLLTQALSHIVQTSMMALSHEVKNNPSFKPIIQIKLDSGPINKQIIVSDNRTVPKDFNPFNSLNNLGLTIAYKIFKDHNFKIEFSSQPKIGVQAIVSFERLDLLDERQVFDAKI